MLLCNVTFALAAVYTCIVWAPLIYHSSQNLCPLLYCSLRYWYSVGRFGNIHSYCHSGDLQLSEHAANLVTTMSPKRAARRVAEVASEDSRQGADPEAFQLPPYWEDRMELWFCQAEG